MGSSELFGAFVKSGSLANLAKLDLLLIDCHTQWGLGSLPLLEAKDNQVIESLLKSTKKLTHLDLCFGLQDTPSTALTLLKFLSKPRLLKELLLEGKVRLSSLAPMVVKLRRLRTLGLSAPVELPSPAFFSALRTRRLRRLVFSNTSSITSTLVRSRSGLSAVAAHDSVEFEESWKLPRFPRDCRFTEIEELVDTGKHVGIAIDGAAVKAVRVQHEYDEQKTLLEARLAGGRAIEMEQ
ncbi:hypothetical protein JCM8547_006197 [Rhodosporidiobolus lusitaniae]